MNRAQHYEVLKVLGHGQYGVAKLVKSREDSKLYCMKRIQISQKDQGASALQEASVLASFDHPNVISYKECFLDDEGSLCIITSYCEEGDLFTQIRQKKKLGEKYSEAEIMDMFLQIAMGLDHIHSRRIMHRDLKTQNIFITSSGVLKIGDFGISKVLETTDEFAQTVTGTPYYMAPEICASNPYTYKSDIWSLGCVLYELCTLEHAFAADSLLSLVYKIIKGNFPPIPAKIYSDKLSNLVTSLLCKDSNKRPSLKQIFLMEYVQDQRRRSERQQKLRVLKQRKSKGKSNGTLELEELPSAITRMQRSSNNIQFSAQAEAFGLRGSEQQLTARGSIDLDRQTQRTAVDQDACILSQTKKTKNKDVGCWSGEAQYQERTSSGKLQFWQIPTHDPKTGKEFTTQERLRIKKRIESNPYSRGTSKNYNSKRDNYYYEDSTQDTYISPQSSLRHNSTSSQRDYIDADIINNKNKQPTYGFQFKPSNTQVDSPTGYENSDRAITSRGFYPVDEVLKSHKNDQSNSENQVNYNNFSPTNAQTSQIRPQNQLQQQQHIYSNKAYSSQQDNILRTVKNQNTKHQHLIGHQINQLSIQESFTNDKQKNQDVFGHNQLAQNILGKEAQRSQSELIRENLTIQRSISNEGAQQESYGLENTTNTQYSLQNGQQVPSTVGDSPVMSRDSTNRFYQNPSQSQTLHYANDSQINHLVKPDITRDASNETNDSNANGSDSAVSGQHQTISDNCGTSLALSNRVPAAALIASDGDDDTIEAYSDDFENYEDDFDSDMSEDSDQDNTAIMEQQALLSSLKKAELPSAFTAIDHAQNDSENIFDLSQEFKTERVKSLYLRCGRLLGDQFEDIYRKLKEVRKKAVDDQEIVAWLKTIVTPDKLAVCFEVDQLIYLQNFQEQNEDN